MMKPVTVTKGTRKTRGFFVLVHPHGRQMWEVSTFDASGKWAASLGEGTTLELAKKKAVRHRRFLRRLLRKEAAAWRKQK